MKSSAFEMIINTYIKRESRKEKENTREKQCAPVQEVVVLQHLLRPVDLVREPPQLAGFGDPPLQVPLLVDAVGRVEQQIVHHYAVGLLLGDRVVKMVQTQEPKVIFN
jgi:hypothetical protein